MEYLYTGVGSLGQSGLGLLHYGGLSSVKHDGQLKRICAPIISLLRLLVFLEPDENYGNPYCEQFVRLPLVELSKLNFHKHILREGEGSISNAFSGGKLRLGNSEHALELLLLLKDCHMTPAGDEDPIDIKVLLGNHPVCEERFIEWAQQRTNETVIILSYIFLLILLL